MRRLLIAPQPVGAFRVRPGGWQTASLLLLLAIFLIGISAQADSWGPFPTEHRSANGQFRLSVEWANYKVRPRVTLKKREASEFITVWSVSSPQELPPHTAYVADDGSSVVLDDQWSRLGDGTVLAFLDSHGKVGHSYQLKQILPADEELHASRSISSIHWAFHGGAFFRPGVRQFVQLTAAGTTLAFQLPQGELLTLTPDTERTLWLERAKVVRPRLQSPDADTRERAASLLGMLHDEASVPVLKRLLADAVWHEIGVSENPALKTRNYRYYDVQAAAAEALVKILGDGAVPLIKPKLRTANPMMRQTWMHLIIEAGGPNARAVEREVTREPAGRSGSPRDEAIQALLQVNDAGYARRHPEFLRVPNDQIRHLAAATFSKSAGPAELPVLRKEIWSRDWIVAIWAYRGLQRLDPKGAARLAHRLPARLRSEIAEDRKLEREVDAAPAPVSDPLAEVAALRRHHHGTFWWGDEEREANRLCWRLVLSRPEGLERALREASLSSCSEIRRITTTALAALGKGRQALLRPSPDLRREMP